MRLLRLGTVQGIGLSAAVANDKKLFCIPDNIPQSELQSVVQMALEAEFVAYSQDRKLAAAGIVGGAMVHRFPCKP